MADNKNPKPGGNSNPKPEENPQRPPKPPKQYKKFTIRVYVIDGAYNGEMVDEFECKASHCRGFGGNWIKIAETEIEELLENIGKKGHVVKTPSGGKLYYPPNRIYYVEAEEVPMDHDGE